jgi:glucosyl-3-phosphoglycerate synthase
MTLPSPHGSLRACVVVPAKDEEELIGRCLHALAGQAGIDARAYEVVLVLDGCRDATHAEALRAAAQHPGLRLHLIEGPRRGVGSARRTGMDAAQGRLAEVGCPRGLIACTDADTVVDACWLSAQLGLAARGALAIGGRIDILPHDLKVLPARAVAARRRSAARRHLLAASAGRGVAEHGFFSGASMSLTAGVYADVGGLEPLVAFEDEALERALTERGVAIVRSNLVRVQTSGRIHGRAPRGLAYNLAAAF